MPWAPALALLAAPFGPDLEAVAAALRAAPAWEVAFTQRHIPAGLSRGSEEKGTLWLRSDGYLRFEYAGRVFALAGAVARLVDFTAQTCEALYLPLDTRDRLPLGALLDPAATRAAFAVEVGPRTLTLTPRRPDGPLAYIRVRLGPGHLPAAVEVHDVSGDRNEFFFHRWQRRRALADTLFQPALPGRPPCVPEDG